MNNKGLFITFEGPEGAGKSTQIKHLSLLLKKYGIPFIVTREPGGSKLSTHLRRWILNKLQYKLTNETELFLFLADRAQHVQEVVKPALAKGKVVLCDRYVDSTLAYQGGGRGFDMEMLNRMNQLATGGLKPDVTLLLDLPIELGLKRVSGRGKGKDRMEQEALAFHERVRQVFLNVARKDKKRVSILDASQTQEQVYQQMLEKLIHRLPAPQSVPVLKSRHA
jgi:dTMP kinase